MGPKRKREEDYSDNPHTVKARNRVKLMTPGELAVHKAKDKLRVAIRRGVNALQKTTEYNSANTANQERLINNKKDEIAQKYRAKNEHPDQIAQDHGIVVDDRPDDWVTVVDDEDHVRQEEQYEVTQALTEDEFRTHELIRDTVDLFEKNVSNNAWKKAVARQMATYFPRQQNRETHTATIEDIVKNLRSIHTHKAYPPALVGLKKPDHEPKVEVAAGMHSFIENTTPYQFQVVWRQALKNLYIKLYIIKNQPQKAFTYFKACQEFVDTFPDATPWTGGDMALFPTDDDQEDPDDPEPLEGMDTSSTDSNPKDQNPMEKERNFYKIFNTMLDKVRTAKLQSHYDACVQHRLRRPPPPPEPKGDRTSPKWKDVWRAYVNSPEFQAWLNCPEYKAWEKEIYFGDEFYTITIHCLWEILALPEAVIWREIVRLGDWLPHSPRKKKKCPRLSQTDHHTPRQFGHHYGHYPTTFKHRYKPCQSLLHNASYRKMIKFIRNFGGVFAMFWCDYMSLFRAGGSILTPVPLPSIQAVKRGMTFAFGRRSLRNDKFDIKVYEGDNIYLAGENIFQDDKVQKDGTIEPDPRLDCQIGLKVKSDA